MSEPVASEPTCPGCGESERLLGRREDDLIRLTCEACGHRWVRDPSPRCPSCGAGDLYPAPVAHVERSRGTQLSITGTTIRHLCWTCDAELIDRQRRSGTALMPSDLPTLPGDHRR